MGYWCGMVRKGLTGYFFVVVRKGIMGYWCVMSVRAVSRHP